VGDVEGRRAVRVEEGRESGWVEGELLEEEKGDDVWRGGEGGRGRVVGNRGGGEKGEERGGW